MLVARKTTRRTNVSHRKRTAGHHKKSTGYIKPYWPYLPMALIVSLGIVLNSWLGTINRNVLGYATSTSISCLLSGINEARAANGLGNLTNNATLNQAAVAKAADMAQYNYWAHTNPTTGATPWTFIGNAGYTYQTAGENLAYGFTSSADTLTGWMNSPGHRANILNTTFTEVGFAILDIPNYVDQGPQTLVVAMYAQPYAAPAPAPTPASTTPTSSAAPAPTSASQTTPASAPTPKTTVATTAPPPSSTPATSSEAPLVASPGGQKSDTLVPVAATKQGEAPKKDTSASQSVSRIQVITSANVAWTQFALSMLVSVLLLLFLLRHSFAWHKVIIRGEQFILHHPLLDIAFVAIVTLGAILMQTSGVIR